jgi:VWFA-related protein
MASQQLTRSLTGIAAALVVAMPAWSQGNPTPRGGNEMTLFVDVHGADGNPVSGLGIADFRVFESQRQMEIVEVVELGAGSKNDAQAPVSVTVLFDLQSLQKRNRKRVLPEIKTFVNRCAEAGVPVLVAVHDRSLTVVQPFTVSPNELTQALEKVAELKTRGERVVGRKRALKRDITSAELIHVSTPIDGGSSTASSSTEDSLQVRSDLYLNQLESLRQEELDRVRLGLASLEEALRALAGVGGRKHVLWIGEGLPLRPGFDLYPSFYSKFSRWGDELALLRPEQWIAQVDLGSSFRFVAARAQYAATSVSFLDVADRDREASSSDFFIRDTETFTVSSRTGEMAATGYSLADDLNAADGARLLAESTGGRAVSGCTPPELLSPCYGLTYRSAAQPGGEPMQVRVETADAGLELRHPANAIVRSPADALIDATFAHLMLDRKTTDFSFTVELGASEAREDGRQVQTVSLLLPAPGLQLEESGDGKVAGRVLVALQQEGQDGVMPAQLVPLNIAIPVDRMGDNAVAKASVRLLMSADAKRLAVGVRDEGAGTVATSVVPIQ